MTGFADPLVELIGERIEIAREAISNLHRIAVLGARNPNATGLAPLDEFGRIRAATGIEFHTDSPPADKEVEGALTWAKSAGVDAIHVASTPYLGKNASALGLPVIGDEQGWPEAGALISYFSDSSDVWLQSADYVNRILRGANPAELPVQQPTKFSLIINLKTAKALGITVPKSILARADEVIE